MGLLKNIFSIKNDKIHKVATILGIKFKIRNKYLVLREEFNKYKMQNAENTDLILKNLYIRPTKKLTSTYALKNDIIKSIEEHNQNIEKLKNGLDSEALENFNKIFNRILIAEKENQVLLYDFFSPQELDEIRKAKMMEYWVKDKGEYFQYKNYKLPINSFDYAIFEKKQCLPHIKTLNKMEGVIIDAGAFLCDSALIFREYTSSPIISFEPVIDNYKMCQKTKNLNNVENLTIENIALGEKCGEIIINSDIEYPGASRITNKHNDNRVYKTQPVKMCTLDKYVEDNNLKVGLIKTDVEGYEQNLLNGAINTIKTQKPILLISIYHSYNDFYKIKPMIESWNLGYKFNIVKDMDESYHTDIYLIAEVC